MQKSRKEWLMPEFESKDGRELLYASFAERYGFNEGEREVLRLFMLFGFEDNEIARIMHISSGELNNYLNCMLGKTRSHTLRELQALFIRYILQKLPA
ncbi:hypothetical protein D7Z26_02250 [Cohnella endophytica]|uniref:HTH luxR-type domain-containing protein n=1 Tax=Cohnella endophytica TaxID=2419778 RepID=A0A494Y3F6_9BACL|nr:hypothetical protein [Cohnella endophytica]RKP56831.1 hypothetical protein D7Z26_02250 [Cohnella endophytica]